MLDQFQSGTRPPVIVIENVVGLLHEADSFAGLCEALAALGMQFGALVLDARYFVPQSRPRVFLVAVDSRVDCSSLVSQEAVEKWTPKALRCAQANLPAALAQSWRWWNLPVPVVKPSSLAKIIEREPTGVKWHSPAETAYVLGLMNPTHLQRVHDAEASGKRHIGFIYKRTRAGAQRAEVRFDGIAGCLRTPRGGSSRQTVILVDRGKVSTRLLSPREAARLMGVPDSFVLPAPYNDAYKAMGDAVAVPVVRWLSQNLLTPLARHASKLPHGDHAHGDFGFFLERSEKRASKWSAGLKAKSDERAGKEVQQSFAGLV
jgi:DNA (cytosine-5)-methyltransferase 1